MKTKPRTSSGTKDVVQAWDGKDFLSRLKLIKENYELFWALELVTRAEVEMLLAMAESAQEYIVSREDHPIFTSIDLKKDVNAQVHRDKLKAALQAVLNRSGPPLLRFFQCVLKCLYKQKLTSR